jgi:hypothetical protein
MHASAPNGSSDASLKGAILGVRFKALLKGCYADSTVDLPRPRAGDGERTLGYALRAWKESVVGYQVRSYSQ